MSDKQAITEAALKLSERDRVELAETLLESLDPQAEEILSEATDEEIRIEEVERGLVKPIPWETARRYIFGIPDESSQS